MPAPDLDAVCRALASVHNRDLHHDLVGLGMVREGEVESGVVRGEWRLP
jgi:metal-sulfur cluster biosynthetic enzyme